MTISGGLLAFFLSFFGIFSHFTVAITILGHFVPFLYEMQPLEGTLNFQLYGVDERDTSYGEHQTENCVTLILFTGATHLKKNTNKNR